MNTDYINELVATKILGYTIVGKDSPCPVYETSEGTKLHIHSFQPLSNLTDMFKVIEELRQRGFFYELSSSGTAHGCMFTNDQKQICKRVSSWSPALAVCIAGLRAIGVDVEYKEPLPNEKRYRCDA